MQPNKLRVPTVVHGSGTLLIIYFKIKDMRIREQFMIDNYFLERLPNTRENVIRDMYFKTADNIHKSGCIPIKEEPDNQGQPNTVFTLDYTVHDTEDMDIVFSLLQLLKAGLSGTDTVLVEDIVTLLNK